MVIECLEIYITMPLLYGLPAYSRGRRGRVRTALILVGLADY